MTHRDRAWMGIPSINFRIAGTPVICKLIIMMDKRLKRRDNVHHAKKIMLIMVIYSIKGKIDFFCYT